MNVKFYFWQWCYNWKDTSLSITNNHKRVQNIRVPGFQTLDSRQPKTKKPEERETCDKGPAFCLGEISSRPWRLLEFNQSYIRIHSGVVLNGPHENSEQLKWLKQRSGEGPEIRCPTALGKGRSASEQKELPESYWEQLPRGIESEQEEPLKNLVTP